MPAIIPIVASVAGAAISANGAKKAAQTQADAMKEANKPDPRVDAMLWGGSNGNGPQQGLMQRFQGMLDTPQSDAMRQFGDLSGQYLQQNGATDMNAMRFASHGLLSGLQAPQVGAASGMAAQGGPAPQAAGMTPIQPHGMGDILWNKGETFNAPSAMQAARVGATPNVTGAQVQMPNAMQGATSNAAMVNAPAQNGMNLTGAYDSFINGQAGNNPYLTGAIQKGINQSSNAFGAMQRDSTQNLLENVLPSIRGGAVIAGGYGGSRQGIAEGRALDTFAREQQRAMSQFGQNNTDAAVAAQAGAYDADRNRALSATQGLGAQQYGVASQNAANQQQTNLANQASANNAAQTNYQGLLSGAMANAGYAQQANLANQGANQQTNLSNAQLQQQANSTNYAGQLQTNQQNAANLQQANLANQAVGNNAAQFNAQQGQNAAQFNANLGQQNNQFNAGLQQQLGLAHLGNQQQMNLANMGNQQQSLMANLQAQLGTNQLNTNRTQSGMAGLSGLLGTAYQQAGNQDNYALNRATQVNGLLQPYLSKNPMPQQPVFSNSAGAGLGGALMGLQLGQGLMGMFNGGGSGAGAGFTGPSAGSGILSGFPAGGY